VSPNQAPSRVPEPPAGPPVDPVPAIRLRGLRKSFGPVTAVDGIDLDIASGEFFTMLGPSGSGKTTVLRMIAGFEPPTSGSVELHGADVGKLAPFQRDVNTVFQDYALFPHLNVRQNVEYGLRVRRVPRTQRRDRVLEALRTVRLAELAGRKPSQLSGGQRQRVALARALVNRPRVLLLDEPLGALDRKLRHEMQIELKHLQRRVGITFVFVTHDQEEALTMSDRIAVFSDGRVAQVGTAEEVYERPASAFVAGFVGISNLLSGRAAETVLGRRGVYSIRPEKIRLDTDLGRPAAVGEVCATGTVTDVVYAGATTRYVVSLDAGGRLSVVRQNSEASRTPADGRVRLRWCEEHNFRLTIE